MRSGWRGALLPGVLALIAACTHDATGPEARSAVFFLATVNGNPVPYVTGKTPDGFYNMSLADGYLILNEDGSCESRLYYNLVRTGSPTSSSEPHMNCNWTLSGGGLILRSTSGSETVQGGLSPGTLAHAANAWLMWDGAAPNVRVAFARAWDAASAAERIWCFDLRHEYANGQIPRPAECSP